MTHWPKLARLCVPYLFAGLVLALPAFFQLEANTASAEITQVRLATSRDGPWNDAALSNLLLPEEKGWLQVTFVLPNDLNHEKVPLGLFLSGTFSASAFWNNTWIGDKGEPGGSRLFEKPGPIDKVIYLAPENLITGENQLLLNMSSFSRPSDTTTIIHGTGSISGLRLDYFAADQRRPIRYYATTFLVSGVLILGFFTLIFRLPFCLLYTSPSPRDS